MRAHREQKLHYFSLRAFKMNPFWLESYLGTDSRTSCSGASPPSAVLEIKGSFISGWTCWLFSPWIDAESKVSACVFLFSEDEGQYLPPVRVFGPESRRCRRSSLRTKKTQLVFGSWGLKPRIVEKHGRPWTREDEGPGETDNGGQGQQRTNRNALLFCINALRLSMLAC